MMKKSLLTLLPFIYAGETFAHPGHDHSLLVSHGIHAVSFIAVGGIVAIFAYSLKAYIKQEKIDKDNKG